MKKKRSSPNARVVVAISLSLLLWLHVKFCFHLKENIYKYQVNSTKSVQPQLSLFRRSKTRVTLKEQGWSLSARDRIGSLASRGTFVNNNSQWVFQIDNKPAFDSSINEQVTKLAGKSVFFYGTSFCRELYFEMVRGLYNREMLTFEEMFIPSYKTQVAFGGKCGRKSNNKLSESFGKRACLLGPTGCNLPGKAGIDRALCGWPNNRSEYSSEVDIHFQFKTYVSTPEHDAHVLAKIISHNPDYLILGSAEWGINKYLKSARNHSEQAADFLDPIFKNFPGKKIFVYNNGYNRSSKYVREYIQNRIDLGDTSVAIFDMGNIKFELRTKGIKPNGHGYSGPITKATTQSILDTIINLNRKTPS